MAPTSSPSHWVGRTTELVWGEAALDDVCALSRPIACFIEGDSGVGKSALLGELAERLRDRATVLVARCHERESLPYKAFDGVVECLLTKGLVPTEPIVDLEPGESASLLRVFPRLSSVSWLGERATLEGDPSDDQGRRREYAFVGFRRLLCAVSARRPLVLLVDDLQWADLDSMHLLLAALSPPDAPSVLYVGAHRSTGDDSGEFLQELNIRQQVGSLPFEIRRLMLGALSLDEARTLAKALLGAVPEAESASGRIAQEARGLPLLVAELAADFAVDGNEHSTPPSLGTLLHRRLSALNDVERRTLDVAAVAARPLTEEQLGYASREDADARHALRVLSLRGLLQRDARGRLHVYHDGIRELVVERLGVQELAANHELLALAYERTHSGEPAWLVEHWRASGQRERARECALTAAKAARAKLAFNSSASLFRTAVDLGATRDADGRDVHASLAEVLIGAGRSSEAARASLMAAGNAVASEAFALQCQAAQQFMRGGEAVEAARIYVGYFPRSA